MRNNVTKMKGLKHDEISVNSLIDHRLRYI